MYTDQARITRDPENVGTPAKIAAGLNLGAEFGPYLWEVDHSLSE
jgi:hypothetical protein